MEEFDLAPSDLLMVDDLKPGYDMARFVGCDFAAALWAYADDPAMQHTVLDGCPGAHVLYQVENLERLLFEE